MESKNVIKQFILTKLMTSESGDSLEENQSLIESGVIDSLSVMKLLNFLEETFNIKVTDEELIAENFETLNAINDLTQRKIKIK